MENKMLQRVWITKYVLTEGIFSADAEVSNGGTICSYRLEGDHFTSYAHKNDFHLSRDAAVKRANEVISKAIASTERRLERLKGMKIK